MNEKSFDRDALMEACKKVASGTLWQTPRPHDLGDIIDSEQKKKTIQKYYDIAIDCLEYFEDSDEDPNIITQAVLYLAHSEAIPPMKDDTGWFFDMLRVLMNIIVPDTYHCEESIQFLNDLKKAIEKNIEEYLKKGEKNEKI